MNKLFLCAMALMLVATISGCKESKDGSDMGRVNQPEQHQTFKKVGSLKF